VPGTREVPTAVAVGLAVGWIIIAVVLVAIVVRSFLTGPHGMRNFLSFAATVVAAAAYVAAVWLYRYLRARAKRRARSLRDSGDNVELKP
jgi:hypothetical protein